MDSITSTPNDRNNFQNSKIEFKKTTVPQNSEKIEDTWASAKSDLESLGLHKPTKEDEQAYVACVQQTNAMLQNRFDITNYFEQYNDKKAALQKLRAEMELLSKKSALSANDKNYLLGFFKLFPTHINAKILDVFTIQEMVHAYDLFEFMPHAFHPVIEKPTAHSHLIKQIKEAISSLTTQEISTLCNSGFLSNLSLSVYDLLKIIDLCSKLNLLSSLDNLFNLIPYIAPDSDKTLGLEKLIADLELLCEHTHHMDGSEQFLLLRFFKLLPVKFKTANIFKFFSVTEIFKIHPLLCLVPIEFANLLSSKNPLDKPAIMQLKRIIEEHPLDDIDRVLESGFFKHRPVALSDIIEIFKILPLVNLLGINLATLIADYIPPHADKAVGLQKLVQDVTLFDSIKQETDSNDANLISQINQNRRTFFHLILTLPKEADRSILTKIFTPQEITNGAITKGCLLLNFLIMHRYQFPSDPFSNSKKIRSLVLDYPSHEIDIAIFVLSHLNRDATLSFNDLIEWIGICRLLVHRFPGIHDCAPITVYFKDYFKLDSDLILLKKNLKSIFELRVDIIKKLTLLDFFKNKPYLSCTLIFKSILPLDFLHQLSNPLFQKNLELLEKIAHPFREMVIPTILFIHLCQEGKFDFLKHFSLKSSLHQSPILMLSICKQTQDPEIALSKLEVLLQHWPKNEDKDQFCSYLLKTIAEHLTKIGQDSTNLDPYFHLDDEGNPTNFTENFTNLFFSRSDETKPKPPLPMENRWNFLEHLDYFTYCETDQTTGEKVEIHELNAKRSLQKILKLALEQHGGAPQQNPPFVTLPRVDLVPAGLSIKFHPNFTIEHLRQFFNFLCHHMVVTLMSNINETIGGHFYKNEILIYEPQASFSKLFNLDVPCKKFKERDLITTILAELSQNAKWWLTSHPPRHNFSLEDKERKIPDVESTIGMALAFFDPELVNQLTIWDSEQEIEEILSLPDFSDESRYFRHPETAFLLPLVQFDLKGIVIKIPDQQKKLGNTLQEFLHLNVEGIAENINGRYYTQQLRVEREKIPAFLMRLGIYKFPAHIKNQLNHEQNYVTYLNNCGKLHHYTPVRKDNVFDTITASLQELVPNGSHYQPKLTLTKSEDLWITLEKNDDPLNARAIADLTFYLELPVIEESTKAVIKIDHENIKPFLKDTLRLKDFSDLQEQLLKAAPYHSYTVLPQIREQQIDVLGTIIQSLMTFTSQAAETKLPLPIIEMQSEGLWFYIPEELANAPCSSPAESIPFSLFLKQNLQHIQVEETVTESRFKFFVPKASMQRFLQEDMSLGQLPEQYQRRELGCISYFNALTQSASAIWGEPIRYGTIRADGMTLRNPDVIIPSNLPNFKAPEIKGKLSEIFIDEGESKAAKDKKTQLIANIMTTYFAAVTAKKPDYSDVQIRIYLNAFIMALDSSISLERKRAAIENISVGCSQETCKPGKAGKIATEYNRLLNPNSSNIVDADILNEINNIKEDLLASILEVMPEKPKKAPKGWKPPKPRAEHYIDATIPIHCASYAKITWGMGLDKASGLADVDEAHKFGPGWVTEKHKLFFKEDYLKSDKTTIERVFDRLKAQEDTLGSLLNAQQYQERLKDILLKAGMKREMIGEELSKLIPFIPGTDKVTITEEAVVLIMIDLGLLNG